VRDSQHRVKEIDYPGSPGGNASTDFYGVDAQNKLGWVNRNLNAAPTSGQPNPYTLFHYDLNGRIDTRERKYDNSVTRQLKLFWDADDRLRQVQQWDGTAWPTVLSAAYDGDGLRSSKTETWPGLSGGTQTHTYSWGPGGVMHDTANGGTSYTPGLAQRVNAQDRFFHSDWLGSTRYLSDNTGNSFPSQLRYDGFGNRSATQGTDAYHSTEFQFGGAGWGYQQEFASATEPGLGLQYLAQRYYDPAVGRFISPDPIGFAGGLNLLRFLRQSPRDVSRSRRAVDSLQTVTARAASSPAPRVSPSPSFSRR
jgi:RHS repeat-associated protein